MLFRKINYKAYYFFLAALSLAIARAVDIFFETITASSAELAEEYNIQTGLGYIGNIRYYILIIPVIFFTFGCLVNKYPLLKNPIFISAIIIIFIFAVLCGAIGSFLPAVGSISEILK